MAPIDHHRHRGHQSGTGTPDSLGAISTTGTRTQASTPDYVTLDFQGSERTNYRLSPMSPPTPKRGIKPLKSDGSVQKLYNPKSQNLYSQRRLQSYHVNAGQKNGTIYQNFPLYGNRESHQEEEGDNEPVDEQDRQFATAICIFSSVLTMVLVLMFYLVGEAAFKTILLILSFVFLITLLLACFLRRPSAVIFANNQQPRTYPLAGGSSSSHHNNNNNSHHHSQKSPLFLIVPNGTPNSATPGNFTDNYRIIPANSGTSTGQQFCPIHHPIVSATVVPEMMPHTDGVTSNAIKCTASDSVMLPALPPKPKTPVPTPPPIQTIPGKLSHGNHHISASGNYSSSDSSSSSASSVSSSSSRDHLSPKNHNGKTRSNQEF